MYQALLSSSALLLTASVFLGALGLQNVLTPLRSSAERWTDAQVAWTGSYYASGFIAGCVLVPLLLGRLGHLRMFVLMQLTLAALLISQAIFVDQIMWCIIRAASGVCVLGSYLVIESWLNEHATNAHRGAIFSAYMVFGMTGEAIGTYSIGLGDVRTPFLFAGGAVTFALSTLPILLMNPPRPILAGPIRLPFKRLLQRAPASVVGSFLAGASYANWSNFGPIYGTGIGLSEKQIATAMSATLVGGVLLQPPLGLLSDRCDRRLVMSAVGLVGTGLSAPMIFSAPTHSAAVYAGLFGLGTVLFAMYSLSVAHANDFADTGDFVQTSGGLLVLYSIGSVVGPQFSWLLMDACGPYGFYWAMMITSMAYGLFSLICALVDFVGRRSKSYRRWSASIR